MKYPMALTTGLFRGDPEARIFAIQKKEITGKMIVCFLHRFLQFLIIKVFCRAKKIVHYRIDSCM